MLQIKTSELRRHCHSPKSYQRQLGWVVCSSKSISLRIISSHFSSQLYWKFHPNFVKEELKCKKSCVAIISAAESPSNMYIHVKKNWWRLCISGLASKYIVKNMIGVLEVSYSASHSVPLSAKEKAD
jgi:hypothetical protein